MEGSNIDPPAGSEEPLSPPEADAPRARGRRAAKPPVEAAAEEAPKRRRTRAKAADEGDGAPAEEKPKRRIARPRAKAGAQAEAAAVEEAPVAQAPKPRRTRAKAAEADAAAEPAQGAQAAPSDEAPKPRRTRARAAAAETETETDAPPLKPVAPPAPRRPRARPARPTLRRGRDKGQPEREDVLVYATARYVRSSARKARMVCVHIRGKSVPEARAILEFAPRGVAKDWKKLLNSAVANAEHNFELIGDELRIKEAYADEGPTLKRFKPRAMGRATPIHKKTSHLSITLTPED